MKNRHAIAAKRLASKGRLGYGARVTEKKQNIALLVAAGRGERAGGSAPKQFRRIAGTTLLAHAIDAYSRHAGMDGVVLAIDEVQQNEVSAPLEGGGPPPCVTGVATRRQPATAGMGYNAATEG